MPNANASSPCAEDSLIVPGQQQRWKREYAQHRSVLEDSEKKMRGYLEEHTRAEREALEAASRALREKQQRLLESDQVRAGRRQAEQAHERMQDIVYELEDIQRKALRQIQRSSDSPEQKARLWQRVVEGVQEVLYSADELAATRGLQRELERMLAAGGLGGGRGTMGGAPSIMFLQ